MGMELSRFLREYLRSIEGKTQLVVNGFAKALETIPRTLAENSGMNSTDVLNKLRQKHAQVGVEARGSTHQCAAGRLRGCMRYPERRQDDKKPEERAGAGLGSWETGRIPATTRHGKRSW